MNLRNQLSTYSPAIFAIDFETALTSGEASVEFYREDFRVISCAITWRSERGELCSEYVEGEDNLRPLLHLIKITGATILVYNLQFELGVMRCRFPEIDFQKYIDVMRLVQVYDNGGSFVQKNEDHVRTLEDELEFLEGGMSTYRTGLGLESAVSRVLDKQYHNHKKEAHDWIYANVEGVAKGRAGAFLNKLPAEILQRYNVADTELTYRLYESLVKSFEEMGYCYELDHSLYSSSVGFIVDAKILGVPVVREGLESYETDLNQELKDIEQEFRSKFEKEIAWIENYKKRKWVCAPKTRRGKLKRLQRIKREKDLHMKHIHFNSNSSKQLAMLFIERLGMPIQFTTKKGNPSFSSTFLSQWGEGGMILKNRKKRMLVLKQVESLLYLTEYDGRWHIDLKACGTTTGRFAGGSNV